jgi:hypothetical protein
MDLYTKYREQYPEFYYREYTIEENEKEINIVFSFEISGLDAFRPSWTFYKRTSERVSDSLNFKNMVFSLGMVELVSYWKLTCSPNVYILPHKLSDEQIIWWKKLYYGGLGEFFYVNSISAEFESFMKVFSFGEEFKCKNEHRELCGCLVPIGGGKDSAVTLEVLAPIIDSVTPYIINGRGATDNTCTVAGFESYAVDKVVRRLDSEMLSLNKQGFLNGHTPFSAIVAFSSLIDAYISKKKYIVLSNESSANESTVEGSDVNHQFSKGYEFEKEFRRYESDYLNTGISYFSLLRPLSEFQIAALFSRYKKYHSVFRSCNAGSKTDSWCCNCPKCLFVYIILSPFLSVSELDAIFGENLLDKESLFADFTKLIGELPEKPFECVGSRDEVNCALVLTLEKYKKDKISLPLMLEYYDKKSKTSSNPYKYFSFYDNVNFLPEQFVELLKGECNVFSDFTGA